jgi:hypothetical protein
LWRFQLLFYFLEILFYSFFFFFFLITHMKFYSHFIWYSNCIIYLLIFFGWRFLIATYMITCIKVQVAPSFCLFWWVLFIMLTIYIICIVHLYVMYQYYFKKRACSTLGRLFYHKKKKYYYIEYDILWIHKHAWHV